MAAVQATTAGAVAGGGLAPAQREAPARASPPPAPPAADPSVTWASQLAHLRDMGFDDQRVCVHALTVSNGDIDAAVNLILQGGL